MKNSTIKSFRFKILVYSLLSMMGALLTIAVVFGVLLVGVHKYHNHQPVPKKNLVVTDPESEAIADPYSNRRENAMLQTEPPAEEGKQEYILNDIGTAYELAPETSAMPELFVEMVESYGVIERNGSLLIAMVFLLTFVGVVSFLLYFQFFTSGMNCYLQQISNGIDQISMGDFEKEIPVIGEDEFANIAEQLNAMTAEIRMLIENEHEYEKEKDALITNVAHDLRTPLTSVIGYLDLVQKMEELSEEERKNYISIAYDKAKRLEKLIEDLFEFTKVGAKRMELQPEELDFGRFMEQMVEEFYPSFQSAGLSCVFDMDVKNGMLVADGNLLARGISNLFSNAVKYGRDGKIIKVEVTEEEDGILLKIINYGEIISPEDLEHIFDKFYRGEASRSTETGGSGLGLAIAKKVIQLHHGKIRVTSDFRGTVFAVTLPNAQNT